MALALRTLGCNRHEPLLELRHERQIAFDPCQRKLLPVGTPRCADSRRSSTNTNTQLQLGPKRWSRKTAPGYGACFVSSRTRKLLRTAALECLRRLLNVLVMISIRCPHE